MNINRHILITLPHHNTFHTKRRNLSRHPLLQSTPTLLNHASAAGLHPMDISIQKTPDGITLIGLNQDLDSDTIKQLNAGVDNLLNTNRRRIIVDCARLTYVSSAGIGALVSLHRRVKDAQGAIRFTGTNGAVFEVLELMNLGSILNLSPDVDHARQALT